MCSTVVRPARLAPYVEERVRGRGPDVERCLLAASREINHQLLEELEPQVRAKIERIVPSDLTKVERARLLSYF